MKIFFIAIACVLAACSLQSCKTKPGGDYRGWKEYEEYLKDNLKIKTDTISNAYLYTIGVDDGCLCTQLNLNFVRDSCKKIRTDLQLILVGNKPNYSDQQLINYLKQSGYKIKVDSLSTIFKYGAGFGKPIFLHYKNGARVYGKNVNDLDFGILKKYINTLDD